MKSKLAKLRVVSAIVSLVMIIALFPFNSASAESTPDAQFDAIIELTDVPAGFDSADTSNPYGKDIFMPFNMLVEHELLVYQTATDPSNRKWATSYDNYSGSGGQMNIGKNAESDKGSFSSYESYNAVQGYSFVEAVAFDPNNSGRDDHVAYVGFKKDSAGKMSAYVWVLNTTDGTNSGALCLGECSWMTSAADNNVIYQYMGGNYTAITAGNYYGDGKETIVVYAPVDNLGYGLCELKYSSGSLTLTTTGSKTLLHEKYVNEHGVSLSQKNWMEGKLCVDLDTGDLDADGCDDLYALSYMNRVEVKDSSQYWDRLHYLYYSPYVKVSYGNKTNKTIAGTAVTTAGQYCVDAGAGQGDGEWDYTSIAAPSISAGDVNGDGKDEAVVAGYKNTIKTVASSGNVIGKGKAFNINNDYIVIAHFGVVDGFQRLGFAVPAANSWMASNTTGIFTSGANADDVWQPTGVECVAINGPLNPELVFVGGTLYTVSSGGAVAAYTPDYFDHGDWGAGSVATSVTFIASVVAGNFSVDHEDDNYVGQEEVAFVIGMKQAGASKYYYKLGMIGGKTYMGGTATEYYSNDIDSNDYTFAGEFGDINSPLNLVLAAVDNDVDGMMAQYIGKKYAYTDPTVEAVLQSAPYFGDLGTYDDFNNGETSYSVSTT